jgi:KUP system potassium uptake protein
MYSILQKDQKWYLTFYLNLTNRILKVSEILKDDLYRVDFNLGFREPTKINSVWEVIKDMVKNGEVDITSRYESPNKVILLVILNLCCQRNSYQTIMF